MTERDIAKLRKFSRFVFPFDFLRKDEEIDVTEKQEVRMMEFIKRADEEARRIILYSLYALDFFSLMYEGGVFLSLDDQRTQRLITRLSTGQSKIQYNIFRILRFLSTLSFWDAFGNEKVGFTVKSSGDIPRFDLSDLPYELEKEKPGFKGVKWDTQRIRLGKYIRGDIRIVSDVLIVGSGLTASLIAERLAREDFSVSVVEKGYFVEGSDVSSFLGQATTFGGLLPVRSPGNVNMIISRGVGGSTNIYFSIFERIREEAKDIWRKHHGINTKDLFIDYATEEMSKIINSRSDETSKVEPPNILSEISRALGRELKRFRKIKGKKSNMLIANSILSAEEIMKYAVYFGATLYLGFEVQRIARGGRKWFCEGMIKDELGNIKGKFIAESKVLFLCGGPIGNFKILSNSGFRERTLGRNLKIHPSGTVIAYFGSVQSPTNASYYIELDDIFITEVRVSPGIFASLIPEGAKEDLVKRSKMYPFTRVFVFWFRESGDSKIVRTPFGVFPRFAPSGEDIAKFIFAMRELSLALLSVGAREIILPIRSVPAISNVDELHRWDLENVKVKQLEMFSFLQTGGCPMSFSSERGVVDSTGRVFGERSLFISDTSVMPDSSIVPPLLTASALSFITVESFIERSHFIL